MCPAKGGRPHVATSDSTEGHSLPAKIFWQSEGRYLDRYSDDTLYWNTNNVLIGLLLIYTTTDFYWYYSFFHLIQLLISIVSSTDFYCYNYWILLIVLLNSTDMNTTACRHSEIAIEKLYCSAVLLTMFIFLSVSLFILFACQQPLSFFLSFSFVLLFYLVFNLISYIYRSFLLSRILFCRNTVNKIKCWSE